MFLAQVLLLLAEAAALTLWAEAVRQHTRRFRRRVSHLVLSIEAHDSAPEGKENPH